MLSSLCCTLPTLAICSEVPQWCNFSFLISATGLKGRDSWEYSVTVIGEGVRREEWRTETWKYFFFCFQSCSRNPKNISSIHSKALENMSVKRGTQTLYVKNNNKTGNFTTVWINTWFFLPVLIDSVTMDLVRVIRKDSCGLPEISMSLERESFFYSGVRIKCNFFKSMSG